MEAPMVQHFLEKRHSPDGFRFAVLEIITHTADKGGDMLVKLAQQETEYFRPAWSEYQH